eukprot:PhF_6_TR30870/c0_g1_i1/m.45428
MKRAKGLTMEEKCTKSAKYIRQTAEPHTLKDLEKLLPKAVPGLQFQQVAEIMEILVSESLAFSAKAGVTTLYWCPPTVSKSAEEVQKEIEESQTKLYHLNQSVSDLRQDFNQQRVQRFGDDMEHYDSLAKRIKFDLSEKIASATKAYQGVRDRDPEAYKAMCDNTKVCRDQANRWTDNMFILAQHVQQRCNISYDEFRKQF